MNEKSFVTQKGVIKYYVNEKLEGRPDVVFLPGLSADHTLFDKQVEYFENEYNILVWDAPAHAGSRPFEMDFTLDDWGKWLKVILEAEGFAHPILVGQSMGGYVGQMFLELFPGVLSGFISIDSAPLQREYMTQWEIDLLKKCEPLYRMYPWKVLLRYGAKGTATSEYGRSLMTEMMKKYTKDEYCKLVGTGYRILADAVESNRTFEINCPALLICGSKDAAGYTKKYNAKWTVKSGIKLVMIVGAGHNSNTDRPDEVNSIIAEFINGIDEDN